MSLPGSSGTTLIYFYPGNPTSVSTAIINPPLGAIVIDTTTPALWQKTTAMGDNSGYAGASSGTWTTPLISGGLTATGSGANTFAGSTGTFVTSTGANTLSGTTTLAANKNISCATGTTLFDFSLGTGIFKTTTGINTIGGPIVESSIQALSGAGAVNLTTGVTVLTTTGANALTLADGANGQRKTIVMAVDGGDGTLTPTTKTGFSTIVFNDIGDGVILQFFTTIGWIVIGNFGVTIS